MPDWTVRRNIKHEGALWRISQHDTPQPEAYFHPHRVPGRLAVKWRNQLYPVARRRRQRLTFVPVPLPACTLVLPLHNDEDGASGSRNSIRSS